MAAPDISALPTAPQRLSSPETFSSEMDAFLAAFPTLRTEINALVDYINGGIISAQIVGTVSQSGGTPTGAVIERGSNANGEYVRFADGTQICTKVLLTSASGAVSWTFPAGFSSQPDTMSMCAAAASACRVGTYDTLSATSANINGWTDAGGRAAASFSIIAIGRWFV